VQINDTVVAVGEVSLLVSGAKEGVVKQILRNLLIVKWGNGHESYCTDDPSHHAYHQLGVEVMKFESLWE